MSNSVADNTSFPHTDWPFIKIFTYGVLYYEKENLISLYEETIFTCYLYILFLIVVSNETTITAVPKGSDYCETKIIVSFQTTVIFIYSLFIFIFISILFHMKQRFTLLLLIRQVKWTLWSWTTCSPCELLGCIYLITPKVGE